MKRIVMALVLSGAFMFLFNNAYGQKVGYVNSAALLEGMPEVKQADANLEALQKQLQKKGQGMVEQLQKDYAAAQQKVEQGLLSPQQQEQESKALEKKQKEIASFEQEMMTQLDNKRSELLKPIYDRINAAIEAVAKEKGYSMIMDQGVILYGDPSQDVTDLVKAKL